MSRAEALLQCLPDPVIVVDSSATLRWGNSAAERWSGWTLAELEGQTIDWMVHPDDFVTAVSSLASLEGKDAGSLLEVRLRDRHGDYRRFEVRGGSLPGATGEIALVLRDVSDRGGWDVAAGDVRLLHLIVDHAPGITLLLDADGRLRGASRAMCVCLGRSLEATLGRTLADLAGADAELVATEVARAVSTPGSCTFEASFPHADGQRSVPLSLTLVNMVEDPAVQGLVATAVEISELVESRARLQHLASHDPLTGLPNRTLLADRLDHAMALAARRGSTVGVVFCDLDGFKGINDDHGHGAGDLVLVEVSRRLMAVVRESDTVGRLGGDEFVVVVEEDADRALGEVAIRIAARVAEPMVLPDGSVVVITASVGAVFARPGQTVAEVLAEADAAMYRHKRDARRSGRNVPLVPGRAAS